MMQEITHPDHLEASVDQMRRAIANEIQTYASEKCYIRKDGSSIEVKITVSLVRTRDDKPDYFISVVEDITTHKQMELALRDSEARFRGLVEQSLAGLYIIQDGRYLYVNPEFAAIFGYDCPEELIENVGVADLVSPEDREMVAENVQRHVAREVGSTHYNFVGLRRDRSRINVEVHGSAFDYQGRTAVIGLLLDITARKAADGRLRLSEERLQLALAATTDVLWDWDLRSGLGYLTPRYYEISGYRPDDGAPDFEFFKRTVHPDDLPHVLEVIETHRHGNSADCAFDYRLITRSGSVRWMTGRGRVVERDSQGAPLRMVGTISDISQRKATEETLLRQTAELAQRNAELERFNRAMVGRELAMIALKQQVNGLARQLGQQPPYPLTFLEKPEQPL